MKTAEELRKKYPVFVYKSYSVKKAGGNLHISFDFQAPPDISFQPKVMLQNVPQKHPDIENLVFHLGLAEMLSYWKATCSPKIVIEAGNLNKEQIAWFKDLLLKGMGEYFFKNRINFAKKSFVKIVSAGPSITKTQTSVKEEALVPVGGGKDSAVTLELLRRGGIKLRPFLLNPRPEQLRILKTAKIKEPVIAERAIDPELLLLNRKGYLNGHTPFSSYLAFLAFLTAALFGQRYVVLSNERSSNEGNVRYRGRIVNHQYSKSYEFERRFRKYAGKYLSKNIGYFSFLRPLYELQTARIFAKYTKYFQAFLSCNEARKTHSGKKKPAGKWCGTCAKCLFVFLALHAFAPERTESIFKRNLLRDKKLKALLWELTGKRKFKPFECVGTRAESRAALLLQHQKDHPLLSAWNKKHFLPKKFERILGKAA